MACRDPRANRAGATGKPRLGPVCLAGALLGRPNKSPAVLMGLLVTVQTPLGWPQLSGDWIRD